MTKLSYTGGAPFATSRRGGYDSAALAQAKDMIQRLGSYQGASLATGVPIAVLRETFPNRRRNEFNSENLGRRAVLPISSGETMEVAPPKAPERLDNNAVARIVASVVSKQFRIKLSALKKSQGGTKSEIMARMAYLSCISYFTSWDTEKIADHCGYKSDHSMVAAMQKHSIRLDENPEDRDMEKMIRRRIEGKIVAIVGG